MGLFRELVSNETLESVRNFLNLEALALDERRYRDWVSAFAEDGRYEIPVRVTREKGAEWELSPTSRIFDDTKQTLTFRVERLETDFAWAEQPPSRTRHFITNVIVKPTEKKDEVRALSNCLLYRSRGDEADPSIFSASRTDILRKDGDGWLIVHRWAVLDQALINAHNMSIFI